MGLMTPDSIAQFRLPDGSTIRLEDWVDKPVWSSADLETGFNDRTISLFTYTVGEEVSSSGNLTTRRVATERETNVQVGGTNSSTEEILVFAIRAEVYFFLLSTLHDATSYVLTGMGSPIPMMPVLATLDEALTLRLMVSQKCYAEEGFGYFNAGFGPSGFGIIDDGSTFDSIRTYGNMGVPGDNAVRYYRMPHHIGGTEKYRVELKNYRGSTITFRDDTGTAVTGAASCVVRTYVHLEGARKRPTA